MELTNSKLQLIIIVVITFLLLVLNIVSFNYGKEFVCKEHNGTITNYGCLNFNKKESLNFNKKEIPLCLTFDNKIMINNEFEGLKNEP